LSTLNVDRDVGFLEEEMSEEAKMSGPCSGLRVLELGSMVSAAAGRPDFGGHGG